MTPLLLQLTHQTCGERHKLASCVLHVVLDFAQFAFFLLELRSPHLEHFLFVFKMVLEAHAQVLGEEALRSTC